VSDSNNEYISNKGVGISWVYLNRFDASNRMTGWKVETENISDLRDVTMIAWRCWPVEAREHRREDVN
jgi:hypothetical protein